MKVLHRLHRRRFSRVMREWEGATVAIIGGGPSVTRQHVEMVRGLRVIAVNAAYLWAPWADILYAADSHFWADHAAGVDIPVLEMTAADVRARFTAFEGERCTIQGSGNNVTDPAVHVLRRVDHWGLSRDPAALADGRNSGFHALNLAILAGAARVLLLGFDGAPVRGRTHWHGGHRRATPAEAYPLYAKAMSESARDIRALGVEVINCSPGSVIDAFPIVELAAALPFRRAPCAVDAAFRMRM